MQLSTAANAVEPGPCPACHSSLECHAESLFYQLLLIHLSAAVCALLTLSGCTLGWYSETGN